MCKVIIFGGTTEGRLLAEFLRRTGIRTYVCTATEYGGSLLEEDGVLTVSEERLDEGQMKALIENLNPELVVDATHPFAKDVTCNIKNACLSCDTEYIRLLRGGLLKGEESGQDKAQYIYADSIKDAVTLLAPTEGKILVTTGSKELAAFTELENYKERVVARVLSTAESVEHCRGLGFEGKNLICMQGPFSKELNKAMIRQYGCSYMVTKASGNAGGFAEKIEAALECGCTPVIIGRPYEEEGIDFNSCKALLCRNLGIVTRQHVSLVGIGMGSESTMTKEASCAIDQAELIIGAKRMAEAAAHPGQDVFYEYSSVKIAEYIENHREYEKIAVVFSGDIGFYSGAKKLTALLEDRGFEISLIPGISSVSYFMGRTGLSWDDAVITSNHGIVNSLIPLIRDNHKVFSILGKPEDVRTLAASLMEYGLDKVRLYVGENLSYSDEKITTDYPANMTNLETSGLCVVAAVNDLAETTAVNPLSARRDSEFIRGRVPMTKEEVRTVSVSKLGLKPYSICYDVGAGTGSVSIEMAVRVPKGKVYAIEKKEEAVSLLRENKKKFMADNMEIIEGLAPEALEGLPAPTHVFIGGSSGNMREILCSVFAKNPSAAVVINCIALESVSQALSLAKELGAGDEEVIQMSVSRASKVGSYTMMTGENPITIISFTGKGV